MWIKNLLSSINFNMIILEKNQFFMKQNTWDREKKKKMKALGWPNTVGSGLSARAKVDGSSCSMTQARLGALPSLSKAVGDGFAARPKKLPKRVIALGLAS